MKTFTGESYYCPNERFRTQSVIDAPSSCSGFLLSVNPPRIGSVAHCWDANSIMIVIFGFELTSVSDTRLTFSRDAVYTVTKSIVLGEETENNESDFAIFELDRPVVGYTPYTSINPSLREGDKITLIGHPLGLPKKTDTGGLVTVPGESIIRGTCDSYAGNSGSPIFDSKGRLAGVLAAGGQDFVERGECFEVDKKLTS